MTGILWTNWKTYYKGGMDFPCDKKQELMRIREYEGRRHETDVDSDDEVIPDLDDPDVPAWVWDWHLQEGNITAEDRQRVAQHAEETGGNLCVKCGVDMGEDNPRQYCGKNVCLGLGFDAAHST